jgi:hypothetical protein
MFKNIAPSTSLLEHGFPPSEISGILALDEHLVLAYASIIQEHHPRILAQNVHVQELLFSITTDSA